ncbi:hypothetical protein NHX12_005364 [Muraenolepis orangiensis]|uniref:Dickkopf-related protein 3 n=1 Tax=Muraenolepis orangiensis TaxID=630683 RepID=A0A9Q0DST1_9TELE|nr:hypothetical protein NHX12_005364 [Muraenolepis orangiensis]
MMLRWLALVCWLGVAVTPSHCILPEIMNNGIHHILDYSSYHDETARDNVIVETVTEHPTESKREEIEDAFNQILDNNIPTGDTDDYFTSTVVRTSGKSRPTATCRIKSVDVLCTKDEQCCEEHMCVWGQCSPNATKGDSGSICQFQGDCNEDLCCAFHKALLFPVCSAKPIERERCLGPSNHLRGRLSMGVKGEGPHEHCPCVGNLKCQPLGRGSMCLKGQMSSEEDLADNLYSAIDYIV